MSWVRLLLPETGSAPSRSRSRENGIVSGMIAIDTNIPRDEMRGGAVAPMSSSARSPRLPPNGNDMRVGIASPTARMTKTSLACPATPVARTMPLPCGRTAVVAIERATRS